MTCRISLGKYQEICVAMGSRQRNIKFSFQRHILYWYNKINLLVVPKARPLRTKFQKSSCRRHENSIVGMDPMATHCRKLIVTGIYQVKSYMSYLQQCTKIIKKLTFIKQCFLGNYFSMYKLRQLTHKHNFLKTQYLILIILILGHRVCFRR
jgi:hypothetical protein